MKRNVVAIIPTFIKIQVLSVEDIVDDECAEVFREMIKLETPM